MAYKNFTNCTEEQYYEIIYSQDDTNRIKILFNNVELADADEYCEKLTVKNRILPDDGSKRFSLGNFVSKEAELILRDLPSTTVIQDQISISIGTLVNESNDTYEYVPIGIFNIQDTPVTDQNKVTIKLRDNRVKFDYYYNAKPLLDEKGGKANYYQILDDICTQAGVINKVGHFAGDDIEVAIYDNTITATSYVAKIAEQCGMIPVINRLGELEFINPKSDKATTQTESTATLQNVGSTQIDNIELIGNTTQETTTGKNLFNINATPYKVGSSTTYSVSNNVLNVSGNWYVAYQIDVEQNTNYFISATRQIISGTSSGNISIYDATVTTGIKSGGASNFTFNTGSNSKINIVFYAGMGSSGNANFSNIQLEKGTQGTSYEIYTYGASPNPSYPQEVVNVTGLQQVKCLGKNIYDGSKDFSGTWEYASSWETDSQTFNGCVVKKRALSWAGINKTLPVVSGKTYTFSVYAKADESRNCGLYLSNSVTPVASTISVTTEWQRYSITFTANSNSTVRPRIENQTNSTTNYTYIACFQLEEGNLTDYEYQEQANEINLGKNLISTNNFREVGTVEIKDTTTNDFTFYGCWGTDLINNSELLKILKPSTTYTISFKFKVIERPSSFGQYNTPSICILYGGSQTIAVQDVRKNTAELDTWVSTSATFTMPSSLSGYRFLLYNFKDTNNDTTGKIEIAELQIEEGSVATDFAPYFTPIELCKIGTYEDKIFKTTGKNLINVADFSYSLSNEYYKNKNIDYKITAGTTYTLSFDAITSVEPFGIGVGLTNSSSQYAVDIGYIGNINRNGRVYITFSATQQQIDSYSDNLSVRFVRYSTPTTASIKVKNIQLEFGSNASQYEPFGSNNEWYVKKAIGKKILNGTENWGTIGDNRYWVAFSDKRGLTSQVPCLLMSNYFKATQYAGGAVGIGEMTEGYYTIANYNVFFNYNGTNTNLAGFKTWLSTHNTIVYYPLASPTYEKLNDTLQEELNSIRLLEGLNNIMSSVPIELDYYVEKTPIRIPLSIIEKYEVGEPYTIERVVYESGVIKYETSDDDTLSTLYLDASNEYIESQEQVDYIKDMLNGFTVDSVNTGRVLGNPAIDAYDLIEVYDDDDDNEPTIFKTFANNTYTYTGINRNTFDTQIGIEERTENVSISGEANFQKWAKTSINNLEGSIELNAGEIDDLDNRLKETKLIVDTDSARIDTVEESFNEDGSVKALKTTNYTFDADGLRIGKSTDDYNSLQDNTGTYYYEKDTMTGKYTKDGSVQKDLALFGTYYYGIDEENFNVATFTRDDALFIAQLYEKTYTDKNGNQVTKNAVGHFYNGR